MSVRASIDEPADVKPAEAESARETEPGGPSFKLLSFIFVVVVPALASLVYFGFIATDQYTAEARFAVRAAIDGSSLDMQSATQDAYVVMSFIHSPQALKRIGEKVHYREMFARDDADSLSSFGSARSDEDFLKYWNGQVTSYIDGPSGIVTLKVRTFRPEDSVKLASLLLDESETLVNELSERARNDIIRGAESDLESSGEAYSDTLKALNQFQRQSGLLNPETQAQETGKLLTGLLAQKLDLETRQFVAKQSSAMEAPAYQQLMQAEQSIDSQIDQLKSQLTGPESASIASALLKYSELETNRLVAEKLYEASRANYDAAVGEALRKSFYLAVFVHPSLPHDATYPTRLASPLMILLGLVVLWAAIALARASFEDHRL